MEGSLDKAVLLQPRPAVVNQPKEEYNLRKFLNLQIRREDFEQIDEPLVLQGEIAQVDYNSSTQILALQLWWLVKMVEDDEGYYWVAFGQGKRYVPKFTFSISPARLKLAEKIFQQFGTASIRDQASPKIEYSFFIGTHEENVEPDLVDGLEYMQLNM